MKIVSAIESEIFKEIQDKKPKTQQELQGIIDGVFASYFANELLGRQQAFDFATNLGDYHDRLFFSSVKNAVGIDIKQYLSNKAFNNAIQQAIQENVDLIKDIPVELKQQIENFVNKSFEELGVNQGLLQTELEKIITEDLKGRFRVAKNRVKLITRDQTNKIIGQLTELRHRQIGVDEYTWLGVDDSRERPTHVANNGKKFAYSSPPSTGNPGFEINCRCVALAALNENHLHNLAFGNMNNEQSA